MSLEGVMAVSFSCKGCADRYPGCHDKCEKYQKEKAVYEERRKERQIAGRLAGQRGDAVGKCMKHRHPSGGKYLEQ